METIVKNKMDFVTLSPESLFSMSDQKVKELIYETHVHADKSFDEDSLFPIVENILHPAIRIADKIVQGSQVYVENVDFTPMANFSVPLCTLKNIACKFCCKAKDEEVAHKTTISVLKKLSKYDWEAKAVLAIAAFALEYGDFWMLAQNYQSDHLVKCLAILKRVPVMITRPLELHKKREAVLQLNGVIKTLLQVIKLFDEFEKISIHYNHKDVPHVKDALDHIPVDVYWTILTIVACATKFNFLISDEEKPLDICPYAQKVHSIHIKLLYLLKKCTREKEVVIAYIRIKKLMIPPNEIMEIMKALIFFEDRQTQHITDGFNNSQVNIEVLRRKHVLLFISSLYITDDEIATMKPIYKGIERENQYKIVWIPVVEQWTEKLRKKSETLAAKMPWYVVPSFSSPSGIKFIKKEWKFKGKPMVVVMSPNGVQENEDAFHLIKIWGMEAFPFDESTEAKLNELENWFPMVGKDIGIPDQWFKDNKYIFLYGGKDNEWVQQFAKKATAFEESNIKIESFLVEKTSKVDEVFWSGMIRINKKSQVINPSGKKEIQNLLSYKNDQNGWALLSKGSNVLLVGHGAMLNVLEDFDKWEDVALEKGFEIAFKDYYFKLTSSKSPPCCHIDVESPYEKLPESVKCHKCARITETCRSCKCCHMDSYI